MKNTGITRKVDDMGRIVLPIELRRNTGIEEGTSLEIYVDDTGSIVLRPVVMPLTIQTLIAYADHPVFVKNKKNGCSVWIVISAVFPLGVKATDERQFRFDEYDFYDREVAE